MMSEKIKLKVISRRRLFPFLGLAAAASLAVPAAVMTATEAEAVVGKPLSPVSVAGANRRDDRAIRKKRRKQNSSPATPQKITRNIAFWRHGAGASAHQRR